MYRSGLIQITSYGHGRYMYKVKYTMGYDIYFAIMCIINYFVLLIYILSLAPTTSLISEKRFFNYSFSSFEDKC